MKELEERLRDALHDERWSLPVPAEAVDAVEAGARRVRRRRRVGLAAGVVAAVLAAGLGVSALRTGSHGAGPATPRPAARLEVVKQIDQGTSDPVLFDGSVYLDTDTGKVLRVSPATGRTLMTRDLHLHPHERFMKGATEPGSPLVSGGHLWALTDTELLRLDPVTLQITRTVPFPKLPGHLEQPRSAIASPAAFWIAVSGGTVVRLDGVTGAVTAKLTVTGNLPTTTDPGGFSLISADDKAGVVWMLDSGPGPTTVTLMAAKVTGDHLEVIGSMPLDQPPNAGQVLTPGPDGSLWAGGAKSVAHYAPQAAGRGLRPLPIGGFPVAEWLAKGIRQLGTTSNGTRLWIAMTNAASTGGTMLCLDGSNGAILEHYPLAIYNGVGTGTLLPGTGDNHQVLIQPGGHLLKLHGPDRCLT